MSAAEEHRSYAPTSLGFAVLTVSDSRGLATDLSGDLIRRLVHEQGHTVVESALVPDEVPRIREQALAFLGLAGVDVVITTGGTGFAPRDVSLHALSPLLEVEVPGFGELFRMLSYQQVRAAAMLSRATAGLAQGKAIFVLPGSPKAVELAMRELILPEAGHLLGQARRTA